jgi:hypothetical protein
VPTTRGEAKIRARQETAPLSDEHFSVDGTTSTCRDFPQPAGPRLGFSKFAQRIF